MDIDSCRPVTVFVQQTVSKKPLTEKHGTYTAEADGEPYTLPQDYEGDSVCAPVVYC